MIYAFHFDMYAVEFENFAVNTDVFKACHIPNDFFHFAVFF